MTVRIDATTTALRRVAFATLLLAAGGCAAGMPSLGPADVPRLEREAARAPEDAGRATELGIAYHNAGRYSDARAVLSRAAAAPDAPAAASFYLGLGYEAEEDWTGAREAYTRFLEKDPESALAAEARTRLTLVVRSELRSSAREALARESALAAQAPTPRTVAVFPVRLVGADEALRPLEAALADMLITDLQLSGGLRVLERVQVQALLEEMSISAAGYTTPETGARAGMLLRAEHVVQGALTALGDEGMRIDAAVLASAGGAAPAEIRGNTGGLERIFELEKQTAFDILGSLGVTLTASERERIEENRTGNLMALLAYGRGLQALDRGDYAGAVVEFEEATRLDPGFGRAQQQQAEAAQLQTAAATTVEQVGQKAATEVFEPAAAQTVAVVQQTTNAINPSPSTGHTAAIVSSTASSGTQPQSQQTVNNPASTRNPSQEGQGQEGVAQATSAKFTFKLPNPTRGN